MTRITEEDEHAITVEALPAGNGDCLLVSCPRPGGTWRMLMDAGPDETWAVLSKKLSQISRDEHGRRHVDLVIVSHIDHDHIGATRFLFADEQLGLSFGDVWFNARHHLVRGPAEGEALSKLLAAPARPLPWNLAFNGDTVVTPGDGKFVEIESLPGYPRITLLSPTPKRLEPLARVWDRELVKLQRGESNTEQDFERSADFPNLELLATHKSTKDRSPSNGSSIAVLLEHRGASVLLAADAFPNVLGSALLGVLKHRGLTPPLHVDIFKLSHHGSRANLMPELLCAVKAQHYIVSTDNRVSHHPNDEALARVVLCGGERPQLWFNYATEQNLRWAEETLQKQYRFDTHFPEDPATGVTLSCSPV